MAQQLQSISVAAPGFFGLNTQESGVTLPPNFAFEASNCVIDKFGRIGARKGWVKVNAVNADLSTAKVQTIFELVKEDGNVIISAGNNKLFTGRTTLTTVAVRNATNSADLTYTITDNHWQIASIPYDSGLNASQHAYLAQASHPTLIYHRLNTTGSGAQVTVNSVSSGKISSVTVTTAGSGYVVNDLCTVTGGTGTGATFTVTSVDGSGGVTGVSITTQGDAYTNNDVLTLVDTDYHSHENGYGFQRLGDVGTLPTGFTADTFTPNVALAAYGRMWYADITGDKQTVYFSDLLDGGKLTGGSSGSLNIATVVPNNDPIVALAAHNNFLIIFCKRNIVVYTGADDPATLQLQDTIKGIGCIARDSVQNSGTDIVFLSDTGIRSLLRVIQEKSLPFRDLSKNVRDELMGYVANETPKLIKSAYSPNDAFYVITLPTSGFSYVFDLRVPLEDGSARATTWNRIDPQAFCVTEDRELLIGKSGYIGKYSGYSDDETSYRMQYYTSFFDFNSSTVVKMLKKINTIVFGGASQVFVVKWGYDYGGLNYSQELSLLDADVAQYGISEYNTTAEYAGSENINTLSNPGMGSGKVLQIGFEVEILEAAMSIQKFDVFVKTGRTI